MKNLSLLLLFSISSAQLISPDNDAYLDHVYIMFEWEQIPEALSYDLQVSEDINFSSVVFEVTDSSLAHIDRNSLDWETAYYWRIRAKYNTHRSDWLAPFLFTTLEAISSSSVTLYLNDAQYQ